MQTEEIMKNKMQHLGSYFALVCVLLCVAGSAFGGNGGSTPFNSLQLSGTAVFGKQAVGTSTVAVQTWLVPGGGMLGSDALSGSSVQFAPYTGAVVLADSNGIIQNSLQLSYGGAGFVLFHDANGNGVGWHINVYQGWSIYKSSGGSMIMAINLESPFWLGNPNASVSPALVQMMNASTAQMATNLSFQNAVSLSDLCNIGQKGKFAQVSSVTINTSGYLYLYH
jgi:hypothetical protein